VGERDAGVNRVQECMTPVFLWVERDGSRVRLFIDVAEEAPTVQGLLSILHTAYDEATPEEIAAIPEDLLHRLQLTGSIRMQRAVGLAGIVQRIKRQVAADTEARAATNGRH
jgi:cysteine desulfuration protein SufE